MLRRLAERGPAPPLRRPGPGRGARAARVRARRDRRDGLRVLLPDRLGLRQVREGERHRGRPGPRLGRRLDRRLRARHHRPRPARQRPAVRALPQPGAQVDAGHRHRLLGPRPRAGDPLRRRRSTGASRSPRSSPSARWRRAPRPATPPACSATTTAPATALAKQIPEPIMGRSPSFEECLKPGQELRRAYDSDPDAQADRRRRPGPRGDRPQQLDPRRRGGDRRPPAAGDRPAAARRGPRGAAPGTGTATAARGAPVQDRHPVLDGPDRGDRPAEDGLPRACATST